MKVLVLTGMPGSGKSTAVELAKTRGIPVYRMGDQVWDEVRSRGLELENEVVGRIANEMRDRYGSGIWAERVVAAVRKGPEGRLIIIDGCRSRSELEVFSKAFGDDLVVVAIIAKQSTRFKRLKVRARKDDIQTISDLRGRDEREVRWGLDEVIKKAAFKIKNEGPMEAIQKEFGRLLDNLLK